MDLKNYIEYYYKMMESALVFFLPFYTFFLAYASYMIFFESDKIVEYINKSTYVSKLSPPDNCCHSDSDESESDETEKPTDGETEKPTDGETEKPADGEPEKPDDGEPEKQLTPEEWAFEEFKKTDKYKFLTKYKLEMLDEDICNKDKNNNDIVFEYVPHMESIAVMGYDFDNQYFSYWCDRSVPFYVLNIIAIKYVTDFNRTHLFLNEVEVVEDKNTEVFIEVKNSEKKIENRYTKNHFKHRGKLSELNVNLNKEERKPKNINFDTFSKMFNQNEPEINLRRDRKKSL